MVFNTRSITTIGALVALEIVLNRFLSINAWNIKVGFQFVPVVIGALMFGPIGGALVGGLGDLLGALLFPIGAYFPGFTLTAALMGAVHGLLIGPISGKGAPFGFLQGEDGLTKRVNGEGFSGKLSSPLSGAPVYMRALIAVLFNQLGLSLLVNSYWISVLYGSPYGPLIATRIIQTAVLVPVQLIVISVLIPAMSRIRPGISRG